MDTDQEILDLSLAIRAMVNATIRHLDDAGIEHSGRTLPERVKDLVDKLHAANKRAIGKVIENHRLEARVAELEAWQTRARELLEDIEWISGDVTAECPDCGYHSRDGHHPNCALAALLAIQTKEGDNLRLAWLFLREKALSLIANSLMAQQAQAMAQAVDSGLIVPARAPLGGDVLYRGDGG